MMNILTTYGMMGISRFSGRFNQADIYNRMRTMHPGMWLFGLLITVLIIVAIVFLVRALIRSSRKNQGAGVVTGTTEVKSPTAPAVPFSNQALQILDERLARGEIDTEEYRKRKDELLRM